jgi:hypothetical protein
MLWILIIGLSLVFWRDSSSQSAGITPIRAQASSLRRSGAVVVLFIWHRLVASGRLRDPGV